uniref:Pleckstrin homology domain-containing protein n=2 Tax=Ceratitis capitata TaxID=7213 RepID=W8BG47_CERCA
MVKLGSLYRNNDVNGRQPQRNEAVTLDRLEFNQRIQERRLLQEEQKQWDRLSPNHSELQSKVHELYQLDQLLQEESGTLQNLQRDKEELERALGGLRARIQDTSGPPIALEAAKKQQHMLERELSRVHQLLAENSKKLEQTVAGNARLEQELIVLRQKLQASRGARGSQGALTNGIGGGTDSFASNTTAMLESELKRVQTLVGDMQRQRQELSSAVRQLTENSNRLYQEIGNKENIANGMPLDTQQKKRTNSSSWQETDMDSLLSITHTLNNDATLNLSTPLYVDTKLSDYAHNGGDELQRLMAGGAGLGGSNAYRYNDTSDNLETSGVDSDGFLDSNPFSNLTNQEKQEIKTVRIVKRESERRHRDRTERNGLSNSTQNLDQVLEEEQQLMSSNGLGSAGYQHMNGSANEYQSNGRSKSLPRSYNEPPSMGKVRHHHHHSSKHSSSKQNGHHSSGGSSKQEDYYSRNYDKNSNYAANYQMSNGASVGGNAERREHLNPLANAYFAKQLLQQQQHHQPGQTRESAQHALRQKTDSMQSLNKSLTDLGPDPVFQSEAARQIINELSAGSASEDNTEKIVEKVPSQHKHRRAVPREKRRHYTAPNNVNVKAMENVQAENDMNRNNTNWRARDDLDMDLALRPRMNAPDVVRSALGHGEKISENTIDNLLLAPNKIVIPERYIPEKTPELSPEEKKRRQEKVESIKKMLIEAPISSANDTTVSLPPSKMNAEKKQREHLLQLNQILAQQVMQKSKIVAEKAMAQVYKELDDTSPTGRDERSSESPSDPLPIYQQRDNYFS